MIEFCISLRGKTALPVILSGETKVAKENYSLLKLKLSENVK